jgi:ferredoxin
MAEVASTHRVRADSDLCAGHGRCWNIAPEIFGSDEQGFCEVLRPDITPVYLSEAQAAVANCPEGAISLETGGVA